MKFFAFLALPALLFSALSFVNEPSITVNPSGGYWINFQVNETMDVEVSVVDTARHIIIRRLAAGVLGANAPQPLTSNSLAQQLAWDGNDDFGKPVTSISSCVARVRCGMVATLDTMIGENNYVFYRSINGLAVDSTGNMYAFGSFPYLAHHGTTGMTLRKYNRNGVYEKTIWPPPAGLDPELLGVYKLLSLPGNRYLPKTEAVDAPQFGGMPVTYENSFMCPQLVDGKLMVISGAYSTSSLDPSFRYVTINPDGTTGATGLLVKSPLMRTTGANSFSGPSYITLSANNSYFLLSGFYQNRISGTDTFPVDTGFWRDGRVYKVDKVSGVATIFISIDSSRIPKTASGRRGLMGPSPSGSLGYMAALHGTAVDDSGHIYVCDRVNQELGIYDTNGTRLSGIPVSNPDQVVYNKKTGAIYVLRRQFSYVFNNSYPQVAGTGTISVVKFANRNAASGTVLSMNKAFSGSSEITMAKTDAVMDMQKSSPITNCRVNMVIDCSGDKSIIWLNGLGGTNFCVDSNLTNIRAYRDDGDTLVQVKNFRTLTRNSCMGFDRVAVDNATEAVYVNNSWNRLYKITNWSNPALVMCSTATGPLPATDMAISPDGFLYVHENLYDGPLRRYTQANRHAAANFVGRGTHQIVSGVRFGYGGGTQDRGIAVTQNGRVYTYNGSYLNSKLQVYDTLGTLVKDNVVSLGCLVGGIKADNVGNIYVAALVRPSSITIPSEYASYWPVNYSSGVVVKFDPVAGGSFGNISDPNPANRTISGALKIYNTLVSPFGGSFYSAVYVPSKNWACVCRTPRFDLDPYGRLYLPHTVVSNVNVIDNAGNEIVSFGEYGNADSRGAGSPVPTFSIPMAWPAGVASSDDYIYVTDLVNARLLRIRKNFRLDNTGTMGEFSGGLVRAHSELALESAPEPFNPSSKIRITIPERAFVRLRVFDMKGRCLRTLVNNDLSAGKHSFVWNAKTDNGTSVAGGLYLYRLDTGNRSVVRKTAYLR